MKRPVFRIFSGFLFYWLTEIGVIYPDFSGFFDRSLPVGGRRKEVFVLILVVLERGSQVFA